MNEAHTPWYKDGLLSPLLNRNPPWLQADGDENDIVIACQIRLARNLAGFPFPIRMTEPDRLLIQDTVKQVTEELFPDDNCCFADVLTLNPLERDFLQERHLISRELASTELPHAVVIDWQERFCIIVNEEDHIQIHATQSGLVPKKVWEHINTLDDQLAEKLDYVFHEQYGFLTSGVTSIGTGMRISMMMHLPALVITGEIDKVARSLLKKNLIVRGIYGDGTQAHGDFFQISNRVTLGKSEEDLIDKIAGLVPQVVEYERQARDYLVTNRRAVIFDRCCRAAEVLRTAQTMSGAETMLHLSNLRLGIHTGLLEGFDIDVINMLLLHAQPAHLQKNHGAMLTQAERNVVRATFIRQRMS